MNAADSLAIWLKSEADHLERSILRGVLARGSYIPTSEGLRRICAALADRGAIVKTSTDGAYKLTDRGESAARYCFPELVP